ncbi:MAG: hypothetical protein ACXV2J_06875 [Actinomycetes bacterium]
MTEQDQRPDLGTYELRVNGLLGPLLLSALPHAAATRVPRHTMIITQRSDDLVEIVRQLVATGLEVESVRGIVDTAPRRLPE